MDNRHRTHYLGYNNLDTMLNWFLFLLHIVNYIVNMTYNNYNYNYISNASIVNSACEE